MATCKRCGTCCEKGGPVLHDIDLPLLQEGKISLPEIYTIRKGELVWDTVRGGLCHLQEEILKMRSVENSSACVRYVKEIGCIHYESRPFQCEILFCQDPDRTIQEYEKNRLTRKKIMGDTSKWMDLICAHTEILSYEKLHAQIKEIDSTSIRTLLLHIMKEDFYFRQIAAEKGIPRELHPFLLGRPFTETIHMFGATYREDVRQFLSQHTS